MWLWLVQMGYDRGGCYTEAHWYRLLETALWKAKPHTGADHLIPELQGLSVGDTVPDGSPGTASFSVAAPDPQKVLALYSTRHLLSQRASSAPSSRHIEAALCRPVAEMRSIREGDAVCW